MPSQEVERSPKLLEILDVVRVKQMALFEKIQTVMDVSFDPENQRLEIERVLALVPVFLFEQLIHEFEALSILLTYEKNVDEPIGFLSFV